MRRRIALLLTLALAITLPARAAGSIGVSVSASFTEIESVGAQWGVEMLDAQGNPADELDWVRLTLAASVTNASSKPVLVDWLLMNQPGDIGDEGGTLGAAMPLALGQSAEFVLHLTRETDAPPLTEPLYVAYRMRPQREE